MPENYFVLFQLPVILPVDLKKLNMQYQQLQKQYHPDNYAMASDNDKTAIMLKSTTINIAYQTLKDPLKAAEYLLSLHGIDIDSEQKILHDDAFLQQQFELREQLDDIESQLDWDMLNDFNDNIINKKQIIENQLIQNITNQQWELARNTVYQLRYFARLIEQIELLQDREFDL